MSRLLAICGTALGVIYLGGSCAAGAAVFVAKPVIADVQVKSPSLIYVSTNAPGDTVDIAALSGPAMAPRNYIFIDPFGNNASHIDFALTEPECQNRLRNSSQARCIQQGDPVLHDQWTRPFGASVVR